MAEGVDHQAADVFEGFLGEFALEKLVEAVQRGLRLDDEVAAGQWLDIAVFLDIVLVLDVADDLLQHVLDGHQAGDTAVLVDHQRHVVAGAAKFLEQYVEALGLRHEGDRAQHRAQIEGLVGLLQHHRHQVLGQQDAEYVVGAFANHRIAGVRGLDDHRQELAGRLVGTDADHLRARHHDVACLQVGDLDGALDDGEGLPVEQVVFVGILENLQEFLAVARLMDKGLGDPFQPGPVFTRSIYAHGSFAQ